MTLNTKSGFNVVLDSGQCGHFDRSAAIQPQIQQAVMHCVF